MYAKFESKVVVTVVSHFRYQNLQDFYLELELGVNIANSIILCPI